MDIEPASMNTWNSVDWMERVCFPTSWMTVSEINGQGNQGMSESAPPPLQYRAELGAGEPTQPLTGWFTERELKQTRITSYSRKNFPGKNSPQTHKGEDRQITHWSPPQWRVELFIKTLPPNGISLNIFFSGYKSSIGLLLLNFFSDSTEKHEESEKQL